MLGLPAETHLQIIKELSALAKAALKFSCGYFYTLIIPHRISQYHDFGINLNVMEVEKWPIFSSQGVYGCRYCNSLRPASNFDDDELAGKSDMPEWRMCFECLTGRNGYWLGQKVIVPGALHLLCDR